MPVRKNPSNLIYFILIVFILTTSVFFRIWHLSNIPGIDGDEAYTGLNSLDFIHGHVKSWFTPTGNLHNVFYYAPLDLLHLIFKPSFVLIRAVAVISGLLALLANYRLCLRVFDRRTALASTLLLATLPEDIAQSRFGWDPAQILLADVFLLYTSILIISDQKHSVKWAAWAFAAFLAALSVHPTNVFLGVYLFLAIGWRWRQSICRLYAPEKLSARKVILYVITVSAVFILIGFASANFKHQHYMPATSPLEYASLPLRYASLFNGIIVYNEIPGSFTSTNTPAYVIDFWIAIPFIIFAAALAYACVTIWRRDPERKPDRLLFAGWLASGALLFAIGGPTAFRIPNERYALCLILPGALVVCRAILMLTEARPNLRAIARAGGVLTCLALLGSFYICYFRYFETTGGKSYYKFMTNKAEPKLAAWNLIRSQSTGNDNFIIISTEYWNYQPLAYLADTDDRANVTYPNAFNAPSASPILRAAVHAGRVWSVEFHNSPGSQATHTFLKTKHIPFVEQQITSYSGYPILDIIHWHPKPD